VDSKSSGLPDPDLDPLFRITDPYLRYSYNNRENAKQSLPAAASLLT
jgi:hypothetical protein